ncbi:transmembrane protein 256 homolog [Styela clava]|uniref:transmembrane protein 256 homolog n=1 Tax=Styela clava TaxID=7725 RepID=UPI00193A2567|nr:transmembrane protein 256 homolog [Styela clava]
MASYYGRLFVRIAGISGASAVGLAAYGAHGIHKEDEHRKLIFDNANRQHFFHTLALLAVSRCKYPLLTGAILTTGMLVFCGSCYYQSITGDSSIRPITPYGGILLIVGWLSMVL